MTPRAFWKLCKDHDWTYIYTDDHRVWRRGNQESIEILAAMKAQPELRTIYNEWLKYLNKQQDEPKEPK